MEYFEAFPALADVYLEDSWVLAVRQADSTVTFELDLVLTERHPRYAAPEADEQYCHVRADLMVSGRRINLEHGDPPPATDATGAIDLGNIDSFRLDGNDTWHLEGDWGQLETKDADVTVHFR